MNLFCSVGCMTSTLQRKKFTNYKDPPEKVNSELQQHLKSKNISLLYSMCIACYVLNNSVIVGQLRLPSLVGKRVVIHVTAWITGVETFIQKTGAAYGCMVTVTKVCVCRLGLRPKLNMVPACDAWRRCSYGYVTCGYIYI